MAAGGCKIEDKSAKSELLLNLRLSSGLALLIVLLLAGCAGFPPVELPDTLTPPAGAVENLSWELLEPGLEYAVLPPGEFIPGIHFIRVDPGRPGLEIRPREPYVRGAGPEQVFEDTGATVIFNATPFRYTFGLDGFRMQPVGAYLVEGISYGRAQEGWGVLWRGLDGRYRITEGLPEDARAAWAAGGYKKIIEQGKNIGIHGERRARTAVGLTGKAGDVGARMYILVVEGEERGRPGLTSREVAMIMERLGVREALNLDGGNSSLLMVGGEPVYQGGRRRMACYLVLFLDGF